MNKMGGGGALTLSSTSSMLKSLPSPRELLHVRMLLLLVTRARIVHLGETEETELNYDSSPKRFIMLQLNNDGNWASCWPTWNIFPTANRRQPKETNFQKALSVRDKGWSGF